MLSAETAILPGAGSSSSRDAPQVLRIARYKSLVSDLSRCWAAEGIVRNTVLKGGNSLWISSRVSVTSALLLLLGFICSPARDSIREPSAPQLSPEADFHSQTPAVWGPAGWAISPRRSSSLRKGSPTWGRAPTRVPGSLLPVSLTMLSLHLIQGSHFPEEQRLAVM